MSKDFDMLVSIFHRRQELEHANQKLDRAKEGKKAAEGALDSALAELDEYVNESQSATAKPANAKRKKPAPLLALTP